MLAIMTKLATSPVTADSPLATSRMITSGLAKRCAIRSQAGVGLEAAASLTPYFNNRAAASRELSPASEASKLSSTAAVGRVQKAASVIGSAFTSDRHGQCRPVALSEQMHRLLG